MNPLTWLRARPRWVWWAVGGMAVALGAAYAAGRWAAPTRVETVDTSTSFVAWDWRQDSHITTTAGPTTTTTTTRRAPARPAQPPTPGPGGELVCPECPEVEETTTVVQAGPVVTTRDDHAAGGGQSLEETTHQVVTERAGPRVAVLATVGAGFSSGGVSAPAYGVLVTATVAGPLTVAVQGEGNTQGGSARVGVGLTF